MESFSVPTPKPLLYTTGLSTDGRFAFTKSPDQPVSFYLRPPFSKPRKIDLSAEIDEATGDSLAVAFRLTETGTTHAAVLCGDQSRVVLINLSTGTLAGQFEVMGARCLAFGEYGNVLFLGAEAGHLFRVAITDNEDGRLNAEVFILESLAESDIDQVDVNPLGESHLLARLDNGKLLGYDAAFAWLDYQELASYFEDQAPTYRLHARHFCGTNGGSSVAVMRRNGELLLFKSGSVIQLKVTNPEGESVPRGITASSKYDVIFYGTHDVIGINVDRVDEPAAGDGQVRVVQEPLGRFAQPILAVVESPLDGQIIVMHE